MDASMAIANRSQTIANFTIIIVSILVVVACLGIGIMLSRGIIGPLSELTSAAQTIGKGDLTTEVKVEREDELGILANVFRGMISSLRSLVQKTKQAGTQIVTASNQILAASQQQATGIEEEATQISQVATSAKQLSVTAKGVTDHSNEIAKSSTNSVQMAVSGSERVENLVNEMEKIRQTTLETAKKIEGLGERSQAITEIVSLIEDIADQTNLLSLNAAIEAARAGEAGRGFAVVADAIGKLADRTTKSTKDISELVKGIQQDTSSSVLSMEQSTKETEAGSTLAQEAGRMIKEIVSSFEHVAQSAKEISLSSQQQSSGSEQISKAMAGIDQIMKQSAAGAKQSTESARDLSNLAEELKQAIGQFRLAEEK
jgi:methyl-accepting chemotaxis protein